MSRFKAIFSLTSFFALLVVLAAFLTLLTANLSHYLGFTSEFLPGLYFSFQLFFGFIVSIIIAAPVIVYVNARFLDLREKIQVKAVARIEINPRLSRKWRVLLQMVIFFITLGIAAAVLALIGANLSYYFGDSMEILAGIYWSFNTFFSYIVAFVVTPLIVAYVNVEREKLKEII